ncbi:MAG: hypothetical protein AAF481_17165 [Acidobacteriota bacterium]
MKTPTEDHLLDDLAADAPMRRMRSRFESLMKEKPRGRKSPSRWLAWAAAAVLAVAGFLALRPTPTPPPDDLGDPRIVLALLQDPSTFERLRGVSAAGDLGPAQPLLTEALLRRLEEDDSLNVRLLALEILLDQDLAVDQTDRLIELLMLQETAIVQAHLGLRLRQQRFVSPRDFEHLIARPEVLRQARVALSPKEET